jgi:ribosome-associated heat shock protein Hsp15
MSLESCRIDVWLWRARFAKTRSLAAAMVEKGAIRLTHIAVRVVRMGERRGPPEEARALYEPLDAPT